MQRVVGRGDDDGDGDGDAGELSRQDGSFGLWHSSPEADECSWFPQHVHPRAFTPRSAASRIGGTTDGAAKSLGSETQPACA